MGKIGACLAPETSSSLVRLATKLSVGKPGLIRLVRSEKIASSNLATQTNNAGILLGEDSAFQADGRGSNPRTRSNLLRREALLRR